MSDVNRIAKALRKAKRDGVCEGRWFTCGKETYNVNKLLCDCLTVIEEMSDAIHDMYYACIDAEEAASGKRYLILEDKK